MARTSNRAHAPAPRIDRPRGALLLALALSLTPWALPGQDPAAGAPAPDAPAPQADAAELPPGAAATIDGEVAITLEEYQQHLLRIYGRGPLRDLLYQELLDRELASRGLTLEDGAAENQAEGRWRQFLDARHQGNLEAATAELERSGYTPDGYRELLLVEARRGAAEDVLVLARREVDDEQLRARFEQVHGVDGVRVEVRHLFLNRARVDAELKRAGVSDADRTPAALQAELERRGRTLLGRIEGGEDFERLAREVSHDLSVRQNGGIIPNYNYRRYGETFAAAVRAAEIGATVGPVASPAGIHILRVESRVRTEFESVRAELTEILAAEPATFAERGELRAALFATHAIQTF